MSNAAHKGFSKLVLTPSEVSDQLGISMDKVYGLMRGKRLPHIKIGRRYFIPKHVLEAWLIKESEESVL